MHRRSEDDAHRCDHSRRSLQTAAAVAARSDALPTCTTQLAVDGAAAVRRDGGRGSSAQRCRRRCRRPPSMRGGPLSWCATHLVHPIHSRKSPRPDGRSSRRSKRLVGRSVAQRVGRIRRISGDARSPFGLADTPRPSESDSWRLCLPRGRGTARSCQAAALAASASDPGWPLLGAPIASGGRFGGRASAAACAGCFFSPPPLVVLRPISPWTSSWVRLD